MINLSLAVTFLVSSFIYFRWTFGVKSGKVKFFVLKILFVVLFVTQIILLSNPAKVTFLRNSEILKSCALYNFL